MSIVAVSILRPESGILVMQKSLETSYCDPLTFLDYVLRRLMLDWLDLIGSRKSKKKLVTRWSDSKRL